MDQHQVARVQVDAEELLFDAECDIEIRFAHSPRLPRLPVLNRAGLVERKCCNFENGDGERLDIEGLCSHLEQPVDELHLSPNIRAAHPPHLPLPNHVHGLVSLDCSPRRVKLAKPLLGLHPSFDRSMVLLQDIVQVLDRPMSAAAAQPLLEFRSVALNPSPDRSVVSLQAAFIE